MKQSTVACLEVVCGNPGVNYSAINLCGEREQEETHEYLISTLGRSGIKVCNQYCDVKDYTVK